MRAGTLLKVLAVIAAAFVLLGVVAAHTGYGETHAPAPTTTR